MRVISAIVLWAVLLSSARAQEITIAAAADLRPALEEIAAHFKTLSAAHIKTIYGSSGNFYQQIQNGAPFDLFFSANTDYPKKLESAGLIVRKLLRVRSRQNCAPGFSEFKAGLETWAE